ncbi:hypothetical protein GYA19_06300 [Candidatus Beckwithbacteria bacterium]|nr:hypothetical protein [Candidatus Beckwithbacteria bacterium]
MQFKTKIETNIVLDFLKNKFDSSINKVEFLTGGEGSQAFSFGNNEKDYVIRINKNSNRAFLKDKYAFENYGKFIPIPKIYQIGQLDNGYYFAILQFLKKLKGLILPVYPISR